MSVPMPEFVEPVDPDEDEESDVLFDVDVPDPAQAKPHP